MKFFDHMIRQEESRLMNDVRELDNAKDDKDVKEITARIKDRIKEIVALKYLNEVDKNW